MPAQIDPDHASRKPTAAGDVADVRRRLRAPAPTAEEADADTENISTTNLTVTDKWGNVVEYTLTIEQTGGSGIVVPGRGFLLNNELTDFSTVYDANDPNRIQPGKRPRSLDVADDRAAGRQAGPRARLAGRLDDHHDGAADAVQPDRPRHDAARGDRGAAGLAAQHRHGHRRAGVHRRRTARELEDVYGHDLLPSGDGLTSAAEIGAATAIEFGPDGRLTAVAEPKRRGGGAAYVVSPTP